MRDACWALCVASLVAAGAARAEDARPPPRAEGAAHVVPYDQRQKVRVDERDVGEVKPADVPVPPMPEGDVFTRLRGRLQVSASTIYEGWPAEKAVDGNPKTSWFSASGDAAALKTRPWLEVTFPEDVAIQHVTALGNREPAWLRNYSIVVARIELYDAKGNLLASQGNETAVPSFDIEFRFKAPVAKVRRLKFFSQSDQGDKNPYRDVAIGELRAW